MNLHLQRREKPAAQNAAQCAFAAQARATNIYMMMGQARAAQIESGQPLNEDAELSNIEYRLCNRGRQPHIEHRRGHKIFPHVTPAQWEQIQQAAGRAVQDYPRLFGLSGLAPVLGQLLLRMMEMARSHNVLLEARDLPDMAQILLPQLVENIRVFGCEDTPEAMIDLTLYHGDEFTQALQHPRFYMFQNRFDLYQKAAIDHSFDPQKFVGAIYRIYKIVETDMEFSSLRNRPAIFMKAAVYHQNDFKKFLRKKMAEAGSVADYPAPAVA